MVEFFHAGRTNTDDCYDAGKHVHGSRRVYIHDDASRSRPAYADDCYNVGGEVGRRRLVRTEGGTEGGGQGAQHDHFCHHH